MRTPIEQIEPEAKEAIEKYQKDKAAKYGQQYIEPTQPKWFVSYPFMVAIMVCLQMLNIVYGRKFITFLNFDINAGSLILLPLLLYIFQIVGECYGWQYSRQIIWCNFVVNGLATIIFYAFSFLHYSSFNHAGLQNAYVLLIDTMWVSAAVNWIIVFMSDYFVSSFTCASRSFFNGKFIWLRTIIINLVADCILLAGNFISMPYNGYSMAQTYHYIFAVFIARNIVTIAMLPFVRFIVWVIQHKIENTVVFDLTRNFNPFKFGINPTDSVQFNADGWEKIDSSKVDVKKMADYYSNGILEEQYQKLADNINKRS
jgi:hypothetical protein